MKTVVVTLDELLPIMKELIETSVTDAVSKISRNSKEEDDKFLSRGEVALLFRVSLVTINAWVKKGKLIPHRMNSRVYFFKSEIMRELSKK
jgi:hypothetical protein